VVYDTWPGNKVNLLYNAPLSPHMDTL